MKPYFFIVFFCHAADFFYLKSIVNCLARFRKLDGLRGLIILRSLYLSFYFYGWNIRLLECHLERILELAEESENRYERRASLSHRNADNEQLQLWHVSQRQLKKGANPYSIKAEHVWTPTLSNQCWRTLIYAGHVRLTNEMQRCQSKRQKWVIVPNKRDRYTLSFETQIIICTFSAIDANICKCISQKLLSKSPSADKFLK